MFIKHKVLMSILLVAVVAVAAVGSRLAVQNSGGSPDSTKRVNLIAVKDYGKSGSFVFGDGSVESLEQAELRSQISAQVLKINVSVGDKVVRDQALVNFQNADFLAQLGQAEAGLDAQESRLAEMRKGVRAEDLNITRTELDKANQGLANIYNNTPNLLSDAYSKSEDAVRKQLDQFFANDEEINPQLTFLVSDSQTEIDVETGRLGASLELNKWRAELSAVTSTSTQAEMDKLIADSKAHVAFIKSFLDRVSDAIRYQLSLSQTAVDGFRLALSAAKAGANGAATSISAQEQAISAQKLVIQGINNQLRLKEAGYTSDQIASQEALVQQSLESVNMLRAQVAKTVIRSPIDGVVAAIPARVGELSSPGQLVISVVNKDWLKVKSFVSASDVSLVEEGADAVIGDDIQGKVGRVAPSIDPATKKVQVDVIVSDPKTSNLVVGQNVAVKIAAKQIAGNGVLFLLPLQAVRIASDGAYVYLVENGTLSERPVQLGAVSGEFVEVKSGISADTSIVSPVYELKAGEKVSVN